MYEQEVASRLILVDNETSIIFTDPATDPFNGNNSAGTLINESQTQITTLIGTANFDIGHTFSTGGGGLAGLGVICNNSQKARGITGSPNPVGDPYDIDYVAHEVGHQFGGPHTFNATTVNCGGSNRSAANAVEPGSGITIMAYAGICGTVNNLANNSIPIFHTRSFESITTKVQSTACQVTTPSSNTAPVVNAGSDYTIPKGTPFKLTGSATDAENDPLTFCWEQNDSGEHYMGRLECSCRNCSVIQNLYAGNRFLQIFPENYRYYQWDRYQRRNSAFLWKKHGIQTDGKR